MKKIKLFIVTLILTLIATTSVKALEIDLTKKGSISGIYSYDEMILKDVKVKLYKIAELKENSKFEYLSEFSTFDEDIYYMPDSELNDYAKEIDTYIKNNEINEIDSVTTDENGIYSFNDLDLGLYFIEIEDKVVENDKYTSLPILISVPITDENNELEYNVVTKNKIEVSKVDNKEDCPTCINNEDSKTTDNNTDVPYTYDGIVQYLVLFVFALIMCIISVYYINKLRKEVK